MFADPGCLVHREQRNTLSKKTFDRFNRKTFESSLRRNVCSGAEIFEFQTLVLLVAWEYGRLVPRMAAPERSHAKLGKGADTVNMRHNETLDYEISLH